MMGGLQPSTVSDQAKDEGRALTMMNSTLWGYLAILVGFRPKRMAVALLLMVCLGLRVR